jgi:histidinol-phosphate phosphatase family protein
MNKAVFLDRDGTMAKDVHHCRRPEDFELFSDTVKAVRLLNDRGFKVIIVTNQSGIARGYFTEETLAKIHQKIKGELADKGAWVDGIYYCPHHPDDNCGCRKPKPKLVLQAARDFNIDLKHSFVVGDLQIDIDLGKVVGCRTILVRGMPSTGGEGTTTDAIAANLMEATRTILKWGDTADKCKRDDSKELPA